MTYATDKSIARFCGEKMMRQFLVSLIFALALGAPAALAADKTLDAKAAFRAAYASYSAAIEAGDAEATLATATQALDLGAKIYADDSPSLAALYVNKGKALNAVRKFDEAATELKIGIDRFEKIYGKKDEHLIAPYYFLIAAYEGLHDETRKSRVLRRMPGLVKSVYGKGGSEYAGINQIVGEHYYGMSDHTGAARHFERALKIYSDIYGGDAFQVGLAKFWLGKIAAGAGRRRIAEKNYSESLDIFENTTPVGHELQLTSHAFLVDLYEGWGKSEKATEHCVAISKMRPSEGVNGYTPLYRKFPIYPPNAARLGREGNVIVEFTVTSQGFVIDAHVVESSGRSEFDVAALKAIEGFRYAPAIIDGELVAISDVRNLIKFVMAK